MGIRNPVLLSLENEVGVTFLLFVIFREDQKEAVGTAETVGAAGAAGAG